VPESSIDIETPQAGTIQPYQLAVTGWYNNLSGVSAWIRVTCSFDTGGGTHTFYASAPVGAGTSGPYTANFPHTSGQTDVSVRAGLHEYQYADGILYAAAVVGDLELNNNPPIKITRGGFGGGLFLMVDPNVKPDPNTNVRIGALDNGDFKIAGTYDKTKGSKVGVVLFGGKKKRTHLIYEAQDAEVTVVGDGTWSATIPQAAFQGQKPRSALVILYNANRNYVAADSVAIK
jgi:hypothetical protein